MKKLLLLLTLTLSLNFYSQEIVTTKSGKSVQLNIDNTWQYVENESKILSEKDFRTGTDGLVTSNFGTKVYVNDGNNNNVPCKFSLTIGDKDSAFKEFKDLDIKAIYLMIFEVCANAQYSLKNKSTYYPREINVFFYNSKWAVECKYTAQNDFGATKDGKETLFFFPNGKKMTDLELIESEKKKSK